MLLLFFFGAVADVRAAALATAGHGLAVDTAFYAHVTASAAAVFAVVLTVAAVVVAAGVTTAGFAVAAVVPYSLLCLLLLLLLLLMKLLLSCFADVLVAFIDAIDCTFAAVVTTAA